MRQVIILLFILLFSHLSSCQLKSVECPRTIEADFGYGIDHFENLSPDDPSPMNKAFYFSKFIKYPSSKTLLSQEQAIEVLHKFHVSVDLTDTSLVISDNRRMESTPIAFESIYDSEYFSEAGLVCSKPQYFTFGKSMYFLVYVFPLLGNSNWPLKRGFLVNVSTMGVNAKSFPELQMSDSHYCLDDFDQNGTLDYLHLDAKKEVVDFYEYVQSGFRKKGCFLIVKNFMDRFYQIDTVKSIQASVIWKAQ
ncbi:MAG: hypothetical protein EOP48_34480 [Sphingobacteriales bacterium]|nr:MAG: hypothetical protein EOP48_34480 [Sphingobacteriales bacterium]